MLSGHHVLRFGAAISEYRFVNVCLVFTSEYMRRTMTSVTTQSTSFICSVFGRARTSLSLAMRVLVVNIFMYTLLSYPYRHFLMPRVLLQEVERKALRF